MDLIHEFVQRYRKEYDFYEQAARLVAQLLDNALQGAGVRAIVTSRPKSPSRLEEKIRQCSSSKNYSTFDDIYRDIVDLAGVRVALYFPAERDQVGKLISDSFDLIDPPKEFPGESLSSYQKRFSGYWATHFRVHLRESSLNEAQRRYVDAAVEIQLASVLMHAWAEVEHDLVYKPMQGRLSHDEYAILDELNGLVMTGEIALERLQRAAEARVAVGGRSFENHYELAAFLLDKARSVLKGPAPESAIGRVDLLFALLRRLEMRTPDALEPYLVSLSDDIERRPLAEQIVDRLVAEDKTRYELYENIRLTRDRDATELAQVEPPAVASDLHEAMGFFLAKWIEVEQLVRQIILERRGSQFRFVLPTAKTLQSLEVTDAATRAEIERIRRLRNNLVHGIEVPSAQDLVDAAERLDSVIAELQRARRAE
jgi:ppGpp synthetase/RelA/SpoT-type nucleotidyltranferase